MIFSENQKQKLRQIGRICRGEPSMTQQDNAKVEYVEREIIEGKLLKALDEAGCVAILAREQDLDFLIEGLAGHPCVDLPKVQSFLRDLRILRKEAFGGTT